jgi:hypothetical protein
MKEVKTDILVDPFICNKTNETHSLLFMDRICAHLCIVLHVKKCCLYLNIKEHKIIMRKNGK